MSEDTGSSPERERRRGEALIKAVHHVTTLRGEVARLKERLTHLERQLVSHLRPGTDPCKAHGEAWPCHVAAAIEPDTSLLEFLAKEDF